MENYPWEVNSQKIPSLWSRGSRLILTSYTQVENMADDNAPAPVKRGRGRPKGPEKPKPDDVSF